MNNMIRIIYGLILCIGLAYVYVGQAGAGVVDLVQSTQLIRALIMQDKLSQLVDLDSTQLNRLLNNFSPAFIALEAELFSAEAPVVVTLFYEDPVESQKLIDMLEKLDAEFPEVKFVKVDAQELYSLPRHLELDRLPAVTFSQPINIREVISENITADRIREMIRTIVEQ